MVCTMITVNCGFHLFEIKSLIVDAMTGLLSCCVHCACDKPIKQRFENDAAVAVLGMNCILEHFVMIEMIRKKAWKDVANAEHGFENNYFLFYFFHMKRMFLLH